MVTSGRGTGRDLVAPRGWEPVDAGTLAAARDRACQGLSQVLDDSVDLGTLSASEMSRALELLTIAEPDDSFHIDPSDMFAASCMAPLPPLHATVEVLRPGPLRTNISRHLLRLVGAPPLPHSDAATLNTMWDLDRALQPLASHAPPRPANFAAVLCARKRPGHFPLRHHHVRTYLGAAHSPDMSPLELFSRDVRTAGYLLADPAVLGLLDCIRRRMREHAVEDDTERGTWVLGVENLRLLDTLLLNFAATLHGRPLGTALEDYEGSHRVHC